MSTAWIDKAGKETLRQKNLEVRNYGRAAVVVSHTHCTVSENNLICSTSTRHNQLPSS